MKNYVALLLLLTGCAHDNYAVISDGSGTQERMANDLHDCKMEAIHAYYASKPDNTGANIAAGALGGAIGGAIAGLATADDGSMKASDMNPYTERCMKKRGYTGTSSG